ncbi:MAG: TetR/AcrR family transcriptional regulator [Actinomycetota bacterium]|nr:TetR/AcrR family transcriptional regulator [Actinomycetota bacterium]
MPASGSPAKQGKLPYKARLPRPERRERILAAAEERFAERGYAATSLAEIAAEAGISKPIVYEHFASKTDLFVSLLERQATELATAVYERMDALDDSLPAEESLRAAFDALFEFAEQRPFAWRTLFRDPPPEPEIAATYGRLRGFARDAVAERLRRHPAARAAGLTADDEPIQIAAEFLMAGMAGVASWWSLGSELPRSKVVDSLMTLAWPGLERLASSL